VTLGNNCVAFIFDEIRYELNDVKVDRNRNVGKISTLKNYVTASSDRSMILRKAGWDAQTTAAGYFNFCVPLYVLLGFCEDYKRVVINARHELILIRTDDDNNCLMGDPAIEPTFELFKVQWRMPHVLLSEINKLSTRFGRAWLFARGICTSFRSCRAQPNIRGPSRWLLSSKSYAKSFSLCKQVEKTSEDISRFDDCKLTNAKLYLNLECYPYDLNLDFDKNRCAILYNLYARFCKSYYGYEYLESHLYDFFT